MSLSDSHQAEIAKYLAYFQKKRTELENELKNIGDDFVDSNLQEDLYNKSDVANWFT